MHLKNLALASFAVVAVRAFRSGNHALSRHEAYVAGYNDALAALVAREAEPDM